MAAALLKPQCTLSATKTVASRRVAKSSPVLPLRAAMPKLQTRGARSARRTTVTAALPVDALVDAHSSLSHLSPLPLADLNPLQVC